MSIEEHATMTGEDKYAAKSGPRMTLDDVMETVTDYRYAAKRQEIIRAAIEEYAAEQVAAEREACAVFMEQRSVARHGFDKHDDAQAIRARAQEQQT